MNRERLRYLLERQEAGLASAEERTELEEWFAASENRPDFTRGLSESALPALEARLFEKIQDVIDQKNPVSIQSPERPLFSGMLRIAASILLVVASGAALYFYLNRSVMRTERANFGEVREVRLPDGSEVTLNGNSEISYVSDWGNEGLREVSLTGEAYFKVTHTSDGRKFRVRTGKVFSLDVLGTGFTVAHRKSGTRIVLEEGKVQCNLNEKENETLIMRPGEMVKFADNPSDYERRNVDVSQYSAWKDHKLVFNNTTLAEVAVILEDTYDFKTTVESPKLLTRRITGSVPTDQIAILIQGIAEASGVVIVRNGNTLMITDKRK
jgi:ferric-dicitrate binding protein FerR (iron transport regulator)